MPGSRVLGQRMSRVIGYSGVAWEAGHQLAADIEGIVSEPPYLPSSANGITTTGSSGSRWSTGGNSPACTLAASSGASLKVNVRPVRAS